MDGLQSPGHCRRRRVCRLNNRRDSESLQMKGSKTMGGKKYRAGPPYLDGTVVAAVFSDGPTVPRPAKCCRDCVFHTSILWEHKIHHRCFINGFWVEKTPTNWCRYSRKEERCPKKM